MAMKSYHHGDLKSELMRQALKILDKKGVEGLTLREVARAAKVSHTAPYRHFRDKEDILAAIAEVGYGDLAERGQKALAISDPIAGYLEYGREYIAFAAEHPQHFRIMFSGKFTRYQLYPGLKTAGDAAFGALVSSIARCQATGKFRSDPPEQLALSAWAFVHGIANLYIDGRFQRPDHPYPTVAELWALMGEDLLRGLKT
jgi:AcrR family transcriptional regulator